MKAYKNIYRADPYIKRVSEIQQEIQREVNSLSLVELNDQIEILEKKEEKMFSSFNVKTIDELRTKLSSAIAETQNLYGPGLMKNFIYLLQADNAKEEVAFRDAVYEFLELHFATNHSIIDHNEFSKMFFSMLNEGKTGGQKRFSSFQGIKQGTGIRNIVEPFFLTAHQKKKLKEIIRKGTYQQGSKIDQWVKEEYKNNKVVATTFFTITKKEGSKISTKARDVRNKKLIDYILQQSGGADKVLLKKVLLYILSEDTMALLSTGKSITQIEGILGEIQGLYLFCKLTGEEPGERSVKWLGGLHNENSNSQKFHRDLLVNNFGIQVKNTTGDVLKDFEYNIGFWSNTLDNFLNKLALNQSSRNLFENYFATYCFNIPYIYKKELTTPFVAAERAIGQKGEEFNTSRNILLSLQQDIDKLLSIYTASFLYMDIGDEMEKDIDNNILYLVGGTALVTASQILTNIKDAIINKTTSALNVTSSLEKNNFNIVNVLNSNPMLLKTQSKDDVATKNLLAGVKVNAKYKFKYSNF
jgi:hypothetical protein